MMLIHPDVLWWLWQWSLELTYPHYVTVWFI